MNKRQRRKLAKKHGFGYFMVASLDDAAQGRMSVGITPIDHRWVVKRGRRAYVNFPRHLSFPDTSIGQFLWNLPRNGFVYLQYKLPNGGNALLEAQIKERVVANQRVHDLDVRSFQHEYHPLANEIFL